MHPTLGGSLHGRQSLSPDPPRRRAIRPFSCPSGSSAHSTDLSNARALPRRHRHNKRSGPRLIPNCRDRRSSAYDTSRAALPCPPSRLVVAECRTLKTSRGMGHGSCHVAVCWPRDLRPALRRPTSRASVVGRRIACPTRRPPRSGGRSSASSPTSKGSKARASSSPQFYGFCSRHVRGGMRSALQGYGRALVAGGRVTEIGLPRPAE